MDMIESVTPENSKNSMRIELLAKRGRIMPEQAEDAMKAIEKSLPSLIPSGSVVAGYWAVRGELNITPAMNLLAGNGHSLCLPVIETEDMPLFFRRWRPTDPVEVGRYGIPVPPAGAPVFKPDVMLVPLVGFDRNGHRLGYGAGYYDRTIEALRAEKDMRVIGVAYDIQEVDALEADPWDERLDMVVTERRVLHIAS